MRVVDNAERARAWKLLAEHVIDDPLERMTLEIGLSQGVGKSVDLLEGRLRGRTVVDVNR